MKKRISYRAFLLLLLVINRQWSDGANTVVPDFKDIYIKVTINASLSTPIKQLVSMLDVEALFQNQDFESAMNTIGVKNLHIPLFFSTIQLKDGYRTAFNMTKMLVKIAEANPTKATDMIKIVEDSFQLDDRGSNVDYKVIESNKQAMKLFDGAVAPQYHWFFSLIDVGKVMSALDVKRVALNLLSSDESINDVLLNNLDCNILVHQIRIESLVKNLTTVTYLKSYGISQDLLDIIRNLNSTNVIQAFDFNKIVKSVLKLRNTGNTEADIMGYIKVLISGINTKQLVNLGNLNQFIDILLKQKPITAYLNNIGISPDLIKTIFDSININKLLTGVDLGKLLKYNGTSLTGFYKYLLDEVLTRVLPNFNYEKLLQIPQVLALLNQTNVNPKVVTILIRSLNVNGFLRSVDMLRLIVDLRTNKYQNYIKVLLSNADINGILKSIDFVSLINNPMIINILKGYGINQDLLDIIHNLDSTNVIQAFDFNKIIDSVLKLTNGGNTEADIMVYIKTLISSLNTKQLVNLGNLNQFIDILLKQKPITAYLNNIGISPDLIKTIFDSININKLLTGVDLGKLLKYNGTSLTGFYKYLLDEVLTRVLPNFNYEKLLQIPQVLALLNQTNVNPKVVKILIRSLNVNGFLRSVDILRLIVDLRINKYQNYIKVLLSNADINGILKSINFVSLINNPMIINILKGYGINQDLLDIIHNLDSTNVIQAFDFNKIIDSVLKLTNGGNTEADIMVYIKTLISSLNTKQLVNLGNLNQFIDILLKQKPITAYLNNIGISPDLIKTIFDSININKLLTGVDLGKLLKYNGTSLTGFYKYLLDEVLTRVLPNFNYEKLLQIPQVLALLNQTNVNPKVVTILIRSLNVNGFLRSVDILRLIVDLRTNKYQNYIKVLLSNADINGILKSIDFVSLINNPMIINILKGYGINQDLLDIIHNLDSTNVIQAFDFNKIIDSVLKLTNGGNTEADIMVYIKTLISSLNTKQLVNLGNLNQFVDILLKQKPIIAYLNNIGISPDLIKTIVDTININKLLTGVDLGKLLKYNGTSLTGFYKYLLDKVLTRVLPNFNYEKLFQIPQVLAILNQINVDPTVVKIFIESLNVNGFLKSVDVLRFIVDLRTNKYQDYMKVLLNNTDINGILKGIDVDKLFSFKKVTDFVRTNFQVDPLLVKLLLKNFNVGNFLKQVDTKAWSKILVNSANSTAQVILEKILNLVTIDTFLQNVDFQHFLSNPTVQQIMKQYGIDPIILEVVSSLSLDDLIKSIKFDQIIKEAIKSGNFDVKDILQKIVAQIDMTKILKNLDWKKLIEGATTGKIKSLPVSPECAIELGKFAIAANSSSSLLENPLFKMFDSWGKPQSRISYGNLFWLGAYEECKSIESAKYCIAQISINQPGPLLYGSCIPKRCSDRDFKVMLDTAYTVLGQTLKSLMKIDLPKNVISSAEITCKMDELSYSTGFTITLVIVFIFITLAVLGTFFEWIEFARNSMSSDRRNNISVGINNLNFADLSTSPSQTQIHNPEDTLTDEEINDSMQEKREAAHPLKRFFMCFAIQKNLPAIMNTTTPEGTITSLNGIRVITISWVIIGHIYMSLSRFPIDNGLETKKLINRYSFQTILNSHVSVDTFFLLSGLLVGYITLKQMDKTQGKINLVMFYIHRFLRLTPVYAFVILLWTNVIPYMVESPIMILDPFKNEQQKCFDSWWANLLYINNFYPQKLENICMTWTWYLANDMQFYIFAPFILIAFYKLEARYRQFSLITFVLTGILCLISMVIVAILIGVFDLPMVNSEVYVEGNPRTANGGTDSVYSKPYTRIQPYLIGILLGYIFIRKITFQSRPKSKWINAICWILSIVLGYTLVYGPYKTYKDPPTFLTGGEEMLYGVFFRIIWSMCVAWIIYACHNNIGGFVNTILSWKVWVPLGRLSYGAYLLHPLIVVHFKASFENPLHYQDVIWAYYVIALVVMTFAWALLLALFVEVPIMNVEKMLIPSRNKKK